MLKTTWLNTINQKFFNLNEQVKANTTDTEYTSGRVVTFQRNTKKQMVLTCKIMFTVDTELPLFWAWFNDVLGQTAGAFTCSALGNKYYRFTSIPSPEDTNRNYRVLNLELEEVI